jgi:2-haloalkanoic acid dehalogenase type II
VGIDEPREATMKPGLFTFDIFGTVVDWQRGLEESLRAIGRPLEPGEFDRVIDFQGRDEQTPPHRLYRELVVRSLVSVLGVGEAEARSIGDAVGRWPLFPDALDGMQRLMALAPCVATTNSDRAHGADVQARLGRLSDWVCAEELALYKPSPWFWRATAERLGRPLDRSWWHVSAYGDYDLEVARSLGLTCVFVRRPHHRPGPADVAVSDLLELAAQVSAAT